MTKESFAAQKSPDEDEILEKFRLRWDGNAALLWCAEKGYIWTCRGLVIDLREIR